ncbi:MAG: DPP IV N-terminal domain-containing protein [Bryobacteraceae bacterium]
MAVRNLLCLALSLTSFSLLAGVPFPLNVDSIMRGPALVGHQPRNLRWAGNSERVYFDWKVAADPVLKDFDTYVVERDGSKLRKLTLEEAKLSPPVEGDTSKDRSHTVYIREGDVYLYDHAADRAKRLLRTVDTESSPRFLRDGKRISFVLNNNLFVMSLDGGGLAQVTNIRTGPDPEKKGTPSQEYLKKQEQELIEVVRDRARKKKEEEERKKLDNPRKPFYLSPRQQVASLRLSPDELYVVADLTEKAENAKASLVPNYVTESTYTETNASRTNAGDNDTRNRVALIAVSTGELKYVDAETGKPESEVTQFGPVFSEDGTRAVMEAAHLNNKDRWMLALDLPSAKARVIAAIHDDA